jgi:hypothetical protein
MATVSGDTAQAQRRSLNLDVEYRYMNMGELTTRPVRDWIDCG